MSDWNQLLLLLQPQPTPPSLIPTSGGGAEIQLIRRTYPRQQPQVLFRFRQGYLAVGQILEPPAAVRVKPIIPITRTLKLSIGAYGTIAIPIIQKFTAEGIVSEPITLKTEAIGTVVCNLIETKAYGTVSYTLTAKYRAKGIIGPRTLQDVKEALSQVI